MADRLREQYDKMYDGFVSRQGRLIRGTVEGMREEIWGQFNSIVRQYFDKANLWDDLQARAAQQQRLDHLAGGKFVE